VSDPYFERPGLAPLRAAASQAEFAEAFCGLLSADGYPLAEGEPLATPARKVARSLIEAAFTLHHCDRYDLLCRLGGVCLMPVPAEFGTCRSGIAASRATRNLLLPGWDRHGSCRLACQLMNAAPGGVLDRFGFRVQHLGTDGAWLAAGHRDQKTGTGR
jgi:hypothetical protein